jgi:hypothetical protein
MPFVRQFPARPPSRVPERVSCPSGSRCTLTHPLRRMSLALKPTHATVKAYHETLHQCGQLHIDHEGAVRSAFQELLGKSGRKAKPQLTLVPEYRIERRGSSVIVDGALVDLYHTCLTVIGRPKTKRTTSRRKSSSSSTRAILATTSFSRHRNAPFSIRAERASSTRTSPAPNPLSTSSISFSTTSTPSCITPSTVSATQLAPATPPPECTDPSLGVLGFAKDSAASG